MLYTNQQKPQNIVMDPLDVVTGVYSHLTDEFRSHCAQEVISHNGHVILSDPASVTQLQEPPGSLLMPVLFMNAEIIP